jgi:hypothetical protein
MWTFDQTEETAAITTRQVLENGLPILNVIHYSDDHSWAFLCGTTDNTSDGRVILMKEAVVLDPSLQEISDLKPGFRATRSYVGGEWVIDKEPRS